MNRLPPGPRQGQQQPPWVTGTVERLPCPHCGRVNDFRELDLQQCLDTGHTMSCDGCNQMMEITAIRVVKVVQARPIRPGQIMRPTLGPAPATTVSHGQLRKLLG